MPNPMDFLPPPPWEGPPLPRFLSRPPHWFRTYEFVKRTKRGSIVSIKRAGRRACLQITNFEDMQAIFTLLNATDIKWRTFSYEEFYAQWSGPEHLKPRLIIEFDLGELERVTKGLPFMLE